MLYSAHTVRRSKQQFYSWKHRHMNKTQYNMTNLPRRALTALLATLLVFHVRKGKGDSTKEGTILHDTLQATPGDLQAVQLLEGILLLPFCHLPLLPFCHCGTQNKEIPVGQLQHLTVSGTESRGP